MSADAASGDEGRLGSTLRRTRLDRANISEGYSRSSGLDRVRLYEYALGSARESVTWYLAAIPVLGRDTAMERIARLQEIIALLLTMIPRECERRIRRRGS